MRPPGSAEGPVVPRVGEAARDWHIGMMVWPIWRVFLDSDLSLKQLATGSGLRPRQIERMFLNPGPVKLGLWAQIAHALGRTIRPELVPAEDYSDHLWSAVARERSDTGHRDRSDEQVPGNTPDQDQRP